MCYLTDLDVIFARTDLMTLPLRPCSSSGIQTLPHNAKVHYNFANFLKDSGRYQEAIHHYTTALRSELLEFILILNSCSFFKQTDQQVGIKYVV